jgi:hypothetical protein
VVKVVFGMSDNENQGSRLLSGILVMVFSGALIWRLSIRPSALVIPPSSPTIEVTSLNLKPRKRRVPEKETRKWRAKEVTVRDLNVRQWRGGVAEKAPTKQSGNQ